jgi:hypothetical protein
VFKLRPAFAELEREIIRERVRAGLKNARRRGKRLGRRRALVNVQEVAEMASQGLSGRAIAKVAGVSEATVRRILRSGRRNASTTDGNAVPARVAGRVSTLATLGDSKELPFLRSARDVAPRKQTKLRPPRKRQPCARDTTL